MVKCREYYVVNGDLMVASADRAQSKEPRHELEKGNCDWRDGSVSSAITIASEPGIKASPNTHTSLTSTA